jgi:ATPase subunit of ABC transporter with duplicated ATPase domains
MNSPGGGGGGRRRRRRSNPNDNMKVVRIIKSSRESQSQGQEAEEDEQTTTTANNAVAASSNVTAKSKSTATTTAPMSSARNSSFARKSLPTKSRIRPPALASTSASPVSSTAAAASSGIYDIWRFEKAKFAFVDDVASSMHSNSTVGGGVVGACGVEYCGKTSLLNRLLNVCNESDDRASSSSSLSSSLLFDESGDDAVKSLRAGCYGGAASQRGVQAILRSDGVLFVDSQPLNSVAAVAECARKKHPLPAGVSTHVRLQEIESLKLAAFMMAACDVLLVMQNGAADLYFWHFLCRAIAMADVLLKSTPEVRVAQLVFVLDCGQRCSADPSSAGARMRVALDALFGSIGGAQQPKLLHMCEHDASLERYVARVLSARVDSRNRDRTLAEWAVHASSLAVQMRRNDAEFRQLCS